VQLLLFPLEELGLLIIAADVRIELRTLREDDGRRRRC
jgi:hypothetical protein